MRPGWLTARALARRTASAPRRPCRAASSPASRSTGLGELDGAGSWPVLLPDVLSGRLPGGVQVVVPPGGSQRGPDFHVGKAAGDRGVAPVPQLGGQLAALLLDQELHHRTGVEVDDRHQVSPRCSLAMPATGRRPGGGNAAGRGLRRPAGRTAGAGR
jgi:hypothetical protein